jgi:hypothetical protein
MVVPDRKLPVPWQARHAVTLLLLAMEVTLSIRTSAEELLVYVNSLIGPGVMLVVGGGGGHAAATRLCLWPLFSLMKSMRLPRIDQHSATMTNVTRHSINSWAKWMVFADVVT